MTNEEIKEAKQKLYRIMNEVMPGPQQVEQLKALAVKINAPIPVKSQPSDFIDKIIRNIHIVLQTEEMFNACISAEQSCELAKQSSTSAKRASICALVTVIISLIYLIPVLIKAIAACVSIMCSK